MENENYKLLAAIAFGAVGGLVLGHYLWGGTGMNKTLSQHLAALSKVIEQIEKIDPDESEKLKERVENLLHTLESTYGNPEGSTQ
jgi:hypothetical protein